MQDGIINGNGDSRYLKSAIPANITHEELVALLRAGTFPFDMNGINEEGWSQIGTALNKATLLDDFVAAQFRTQDNATPNLIFSILGQYSEYWWKRRPTSAGYFEKQTQTTAGVLMRSGERWFMFWTSVGGQHSTNFQYSDSISINQSTGAVSLVNPQTLSLSNDTTEYVQLARTLRGKYFIGGDSSPNNVVRYLTETANVKQATYTMDGAYYYCICADDMMQPYQLFDVSSEYIRTDGVWGTVHSADRDAYPDSGISGSFEYQFIGVPYENMPTAPKMENGSYQGTGTYGSSNKNSITFSFVPKLVFILGAEQYASNIGGCIFVNNIAYAVGYSNGMVGYGPGVQTVTWSGKTLSWYCSDGGTTYSGYTGAASARLQLNQSNGTYYWVAIG